MRRPEEGSPVCEPIAGTEKKPKICQGYETACCLRIAKTGACESARRAKSLEKHYAWLCARMRSESALPSRKLMPIHAVNCHRSGIKHLSKAKSNNTIPLQPHRSARDLLEAFADSCLSTCVQRPPSIRMASQDIFDIFANHGTTAASLLPTTSELSSESRHDQIN